MACNGSSRRDPIAPTIDAMAPTPALPIVTSILVTSIACSVNGAAGSLNTMPSLPPAPWCPLHIRRRDFGSGDDTIITASPVATCRRTHRFHCLQLVRVSNSVVCGFDRWHGNSIVECNRWQTVQSPAMSSSIANFSRRLPVEPPAANHWQSNPTSGPFNCLPCQRVFRLAPTTHIANLITSG